MAATPSATPCRRRMRQSELMEYHQPSPNKYSPVASAFMLTAIIAVAQTKTTLESVRRDVEQSCMSPAGTRTGREALQRAKRSATETPT